MDTFVKLDKFVKKLQITFRDYIIQIEENDDIIVVIPAEELKHDTLEKLNDKTVESNSDKIERLTFKILYRDEFLNYSSLSREIVQDLNVSLNQIATVSQDHVKNIIVKLKGEILDQINSFEFFDIKNHITKLVKDKYPARDEKLNFIITYQYAAAKSFEISPTD